MPTSDASTRFFGALNELVRTSEIVIDRPKGKPHPRLPDVIYPLDYGYLAGTVSGDGNGIDVFVGSVSSTDIAGVILTADAVKRDVEMKLLLGCSPQEVTVVQEFLTDTLGIGGHLVAPPRS